MPLEQVSNNITFYAFFTYAKQGVTGLTVTADVYRNGVSILAAQACTAVGGGIYSYTLASANVNAEGEYICLFKTAGTVDQQHIPAIWCIAKAGVEYLDAQVTSRMPTGNVTVGGYASTYDPGYGVWTYLTTNPQLANSFGDAVKTNLTAYTTTRAAKLDNLDATISSRSSLIASDIWNYLTSSATVAGSIGKRIADYVDAAVSSRLATSGYTAPDNASIGTILSRADVATSTRASAADYTTARAAKLDQLDVAVSTRVSAGIGSTACPITVTDSAGAPIDGVAVWITTDAGGANVVAGTRYTGGNGVATFWLDPGTYYAWLQRDGINFPNPTEVTV